jgi:glycerol uptake facilitator-like aquaporin
MPNSRRHYSPEDFPSAPGPVAKCLLAEALGAFVLTCVDAGGGILGHLSPDVGVSARSVAGGLIVGSLIYALGEVSGAHFNPAVSLAFAARGAFPWHRVPWYIAAQIGGGILAALALKALWPGLLVHGVNEARGVGAGTAWWMELFLSSVLVFVILANAHQHKILGAQAAVPVAGVIIVAGLLAKSISDPALNPARALGPALVSGTPGQLWIYGLTPCLGAGIAAGLMTLLHSPRDEDEAEAANGHPGH